MLLFLILPWLSINGNPVLLLNIPDRKFSFFGFLFLAHDGPLLFFILGLLVFSLAFATAVWGRVWCGWACPQTVFIDLIYRRIEIWIEGNYIQRRKLRDSEMTLGALTRLFFKWILFFIVSSLFAHSFIAYFSGSKELLAMIQGSPAEHWNYFVWVSAMTALLLFDFGWFREQFCVIMCPYGRFQSVLMGPHSLAVYYDKKRGEPRKGIVKAQLAEAGLALKGAVQGDCVACNRCVEVCPTGIDIRNGTQMECIACTACIDACDEIMEKVKKPKGLVRYSALMGKERRIFRPGTVVHLLFLVLMLTGFWWNVLSRKDFSALIYSSRDIPFSIIETPQGSRVMNHFKLHLHNQTFEGSTFEVKVPDDLRSQGMEMKLPQAQFELRGGGEQIVHFFVLYPKDVLAGQSKRKVSLEIISTKTGEKIHTPMTLVGP